MNKKDLSNLSRLYTEQVIEEININPDSDFGDLEGSRFGRYKGRHFKKSPIPQTRKDYIPSQEREPNLFSGSEYQEIYGDTEEEQDVEIPVLSDLNKMSRSERTELLATMAILRSEIDDLKNESEKIKALAINRRLMDKVLSDIVLGFSKGRASLSHVSENGDPIFTTDKENIQVSLPYGTETNPEDVTYKKVNI
jgi:hypothetical protein